MICRKYRKKLQNEVHTCGLYACLFVINYFGIKYVREKTLRKKLDVDEPFFPILLRFGVQDEYLLGTTPMAMVRVLEEYGIRSELSQIRKKSSDRMQIALAVTMYYSHWIVYFRDPHTDEPMIYDPCGAIDYYEQYEDPCGNEAKGIRKINLFLPVSATNHLGKPEEPTRGLKAGIKQKFSSNAAY